MKHFLGHNKPRSGNPWFCTQFKIRFYETRHDFFFVTIQQYVKVKPQLIRQKTQRFFHLVRSKSLTLWIIQSKIRVFHVCHFYFILMIFKVLKLKTVTNMSNLSHFVSTFRTMRKHTGFSFFPILRRRVIPWAGDSVGG